jgi:hypothetical protein
MIVANLPDDLEMFLADHCLSVSATTLQLQHAVSMGVCFDRAFAQFAAPALRVHAPSGSEQLSCLASLSAAQLDAVAAASMSSLKEQLHKVQQLLRGINQAQQALKDQLNNDPGKYQICKMKGGSIDHFHKGLTDRIGKRHTALRRL